MLLPIRWCDGIRTDLGWKMITAHESRSCGRPSVVEKLRAAWVNKHCRGSFDYAQDRLFDSAPQAAVSRDQSVRRFARMTIRWENYGTETFVREPGRTAGPSAPPDFLSKTMASMDFVRLSLRRAAYVGAGRAVIQEIRVRSG
jgi:hypothetical protein